MPEPDNRDEQLSKLHAQLDEVLAAEEFCDSRAGRLWLDLATAEVNKALQDITSEKYEKDHQGYIKRLADLQAYKKMIRKIQLSGSQVRKQKIVEAIGVEPENAPEST